jgi:hypothetical protein
MRVGMDPMDMGALVVQAIKENRFHILTHGEFLDEVKERHRQIEADFVTLDIPQARAAFENMRRETVDRLFSASAQD